MDFAFCVATTQPAPLTLTWGQAEDAGTGQGSSLPYAVLSRINFSFLKTDGEAGTHGEVMVKKGREMKQKRRSFRICLERMYLGPLSQKLAQLSQRSARER